MATAAEVAAATMTPADIDQDRMARKFRAHRYWDTTGLFLPTALREQWVSRYTEIAKKYSHPIGNWDYPDNRLLRNTGKSGLTPVENVDWEEMLTDNIGWHRSKVTFLEMYQRRRFNGFSIQELYKLEALAAFDSSTMKWDMMFDDVHPIFEKQHWVAERDMYKHRAHVPILGDYLGFWSAQNPLIWNVVLQPCLTLVKHVICCKSAYPWLDALFKGMITKAPSSVAAGNNDYFRFHQRSPRERNTDEQFIDLQNCILALAGQIKFTFRNAATHFSGTQDQAGYYHGATLIPVSWLLPSPIEVQFGIELMQPLLRTDLTDAERLTTQYRVAQTILHELGHAMWLVIGRWRNNNINPDIEPFFEDETANELGYSFVDKAGEADPIHSAWNSRYGPALPHMGLYKVRWFRGQHAERIKDIFGHEHPAVRRNAATALKPILENNDVFPIPVLWAHSLFQKASWDVVVRNIGTDAHMGPLTMGMRLLHRKDEPIPDYFSWITATDGEAETILALSLEPQDKDAVGSAYFKRVVASERIYMRLGISAQRRLEMKSSNSYTTWPEEFGQDQITPHPFDSLWDDEEIPDEKYFCPRFEEIVKYMIQDRGPMQLAIDTMGSLPASVFYRYIRDRGRIHLLPLEYWHFLGTCNERKEYFLFDPYPGPGLVTRIEAGWPPSNPLVNQNLPPPVFVATPAEKDLIMAYVRRADTRNIIFNQLTMKSMRDMDVDLFRVMVDHLREQGAFPLPQKLNPAQFYATIIQCVREAWDFNDDFTLGPEGIIRFTYDITPWLRQYWTDLEKERATLLQSRIDNANGIWQNKQKLGGRQDRPWMV